MDSINTYPADQLRQMLMAEYIKTDELERRLELYDGRSKALERRLFQSDHVMKLQWELLLKLENSLTDTLNGLNAMEKRRIATCTELKAIEKQNKRTIAQLTSERDAYFGEKENLARHVNNLKRNSTESASRITELEDEVSGLRRQIDHFQKVQQELEETQARERELRKQCKDQYADLQRYERETSDLQTQVAQLEDQFRRTTAAYEQQLEDLRLAANKSNADQIAAEREKYTKKMKEMEKTFVKAMDEAKRNNGRLDEDNLKLKEMLRALSQGQQEWKRKEYRRLKQNILEEYTAFIGRVASKKGNLGTYFQIKIKMKTVRQQQILGNRMRAAAALEASTQSIVSACEPFFRMPYHK
ncbi:hypothetical protein AAVH_01878 [Aphelenchoides avenae]|nr:hypothetical protein AAVH_01878 [Aphelenchus avenae]